MSRKNFTRKDRARIFTLGRGCCHICGGRIAAGEAWEIEHVIAYALTRDDGDDNLRPAHVKCHAKKTHGEDRPRIAKAERVRAKHLGQWPKPFGNARIKSRPFRPTRPFQHQEKN